MTRTVDASDGTRLHSDEVGNGPSVICISGLGYSSWCWREIVEAFSPSYRIVTFDNRGTGRSDVADAGYSIEQFADDAAAVLNAHRATPAHVVGHSMGGYIALTLAARHPALVQSLVLVGTGSGGEGSLPVPESTLTAWKAASELPAEEFARQTMPLSFAEGWSDAHPERFTQLLAERLSFPTSSDVWKKQFRAAGMFGRDGLDVSGIGVPALVVHGTGDRIIPFENGERLAGQLRAARLVRLDGAGHLCFLEEPRAFHRLVLDWLARPGRS